MNHLHVTARRTAGSVLVAILLGVVLSSCGSSRSPEAFCTVMDKHKQRYLTAMGRAQSSVDSDSGSGAGLLIGSAQAVSALGDLQRMWEELATVAPDDIQPDVEAVRDANAKQLASAKDALDNPLKAIGGALVDGLMVSGSYQRIDAYAKTNCS